MKNKWMVSTAPTTGSFSNMQKLGVTVSQYLTFLLYPAVLVTALMSFGSFTVEQSNVYSDVAATDPNDACILFANGTLDRSSENTTMRLGSNSACTFVTVGGSFVVLLAGAFIILSVLKTVFDRTGVPFSVPLVVLFDVVFIAVICASSFILATVISAGINSSCDNIMASNNTSCISNDCSCSNMTLLTHGLGLREGKMLFYDSIHVSVVTGWLNTALLVFIICIHLIMFCLFKLNLGSSDSNYQTLVIKGGGYKSRF